MVGLDTDTQRMVLLAEGRLSSIGLRMVIAALLYIPERIVAIIDSTKERTTAQEAIGFGGKTPIVHSLEEALVYQPDSLLIGITPLGGRLPESWKILIGQAMNSGLHIISGLKQPLMADLDLVQIAQEKAIRIHDLHTISRSHQIFAQGSWRRRTVKTILTVGTDSNTGKLTTALMIYRQMVRRGIRVALIGTGPTGILISGKGVAVQNVPSDFLAGAIEFEVDLVANEGYDFIIVEGQSALTNFGNSAIALGLLHGTMPDAMVLCHEPSRKVDAYGLPLPDLVKSIHLHEEFISLFKPGKVVGIGLNSMGLNKEEFRIVVNAIHQQTQLEVCDPMREPVTPLVSELLRYFSTYKHAVLPDSDKGIEDRIF
jgi:uncharacterized NAD-dependent epimerase/dehydratase family protein